MLKVPWLLVAVTLLTSALVDASTLVVSVSGQFSASDVASSIVTPNAAFSVSFDVDSNPTPLAGTVSTLGFDAPVLSFYYSLNGVRVPSLNPSEIHFDTLANGGLFDLTFGAGISATQFVFEGPQIFGGSTAAPTFTSGKFTLANWTVSDPQNYDSQSPAAALVTVAAAPEPSSLALFAVAAFASFALLRRKLTRIAR